MLSNLLADVNQFLPTPSHGGRLTKWLSRPRNMNFYPRPHMEGDIFCKVCLQLIGQFLPTPSHGGRPLLLPDQHRHVLISTHALTWRATEADGFACAIVGISTHALTWRATGTQPHFSPPVRISTHALTWRATIGQKCLGRF